ncbi:unnamed protein product [Pseudo-nitzschia multistriata]|uniref:folate gamma-glutamyl hydrolase n=1 Tax=Pseudo-nitzschia multistriata TaxID=183589 RepID=A0A448Z9V2_9STRA|nr:unnamed protein product [Pseudo-nitzschia multistriata]
MLAIRFKEALVFSGLIALACHIHADNPEESSSKASPRSSASSPTRPLVFGILSQPFYDDESDHDPGDNGYNHTYIAASYVRWLESGGARSIPIPFDAPPFLVEDILGQVDGVLFPGGGSSLPSSAITIWELLHSEKYYYPDEKEGRQGDRIPLWGTCLGMEFIVQLAADVVGSGRKNCEMDRGCAYDRNILEKGYDSTNVSWPLLEVRKSGLYKPDSVYEIATTYNVTLNNHHLGISPDRFRNNSGLSRRFDITSINYDHKGKAFVSTIEPAMEARNTTDLSNPSPFPPPVYGVQYHPEKNSHEYGLYPGTAIPYEAIDHSQEGVDFSIYEARFLVDLARKNVLNRIHDGKKDNKYNKPDLYPMVFTYPRRVGHKFEEKYILPPAKHWTDKIEALDNSDFRDRNPEDDGESEAANSWYRDNWKEQRRAEKLPSLRGRHD